MEREATWQPLWDREGGTNKELTDKLVDLRQEIQDNPDADMKLFSLHRGGNPELPAPYRARP